MRTPVSQSEQLDLVMKACDELIAAGAEFSAFDVTSKVRKENPSLDLPHYTQGNNFGVRHMTHEYMATKTGYTSEDRPVSGTGTMATVYFPVQTQVASMMPIVVRGGTVLPPPDPSLNTPSQPSIAARFVAWLTTK